MKTKLFQSAFALLLISTISSAALPSKVLVGYWHNWHQTDVPFIELANIDSRYNVICLSFAAASGGDVNSIDFNMWSGSSYNDANLKTDIATLKGQGKTILMSVGGANGSFRLNNTTQKNTFVSKMQGLIQEYDLDGIDIDLEQTTNLCPTGSKTSINSPEAHMQNLIDGCKELKTWFLGQYGRAMILTTAPEATYTSGGLSPWNSCNGAFLPFIEGMGSDIDLVMVQLYNSGDLYSRQYPSSQTVYSNGTVDFIITQTEIMIEGFTFVSNHQSLTGTYSGLPASKVVVALPANNCGITAGSGYLSPASVESAINYLRGTGSKPGSYTLSSSYPDLRGMMTWSINNDAEGSSACEGSSYEYAENFETIFGVTTSSSTESAAEQSVAIFPNPSNGNVNVQKAGQFNFVLSNASGQVLEQGTASNQKVIDVNGFVAGIYFLRIDDQVSKLIVE